MEKTLTKHGNSLALIIDKPILELLNISSDTPLELSTNGVELIIRPVKKSKETRKKKFDVALEETNQKYQKTLKKLSE
ncbi:MAG: AbrB/MazE/SpoVT family DNA-binding domain-containing protein [Planctomycetia bacterium]|nr:AbrB/MazE/SpoVT family DNA-binding domain-containing protein [Planctomycetia bacterium]